MSEISEQLQAHLAGRYTIISELGHGGMATVFLAEDLRHSRQVAIKVLDPEIAAAIGAERFLREIGIAARISHPHILSLHDSGNAGGLTYYVMPFVSGETLRARLDREPQLPIEEAVRLGCEIADALSHAHAHGVIHRDIKPENVLIEGGHAIVADFGVARAMGEGAERLTHTGVMVGTPSYMSPEQAMGDRRVDERTDLYALGCVVFEMLAGRAPFVGGTAESVVHQHVSAAVPRLTDLRTAVPAKLDEALRRAMAKAPADRFRSAEEMARALAEGAKAPAGKSARPRGAMVALAVVLILAGAVAASWWLHTHAGAERVRSLAVLPLENLSGDAQQEYFAEGMTDELIGCLSQISALRVISRTSVMQFKGSRKPLPEIARSLGVDALIEGTVLRSGDQVRIAADLVQAHPEQHLWGERYERPLQDVLALQSEVAQAITQRIAVALTPRERQRLARSTPVNPAAHDEVLRGRFAMAHFSVKAHREAVGHFQRATEIEPELAEAWSGLAHAYYQVSGIGVAPDEVMPLARAAAQKALHLDPDLASAHAALGVVMAQYDWDWRGAEGEYRRALQSDPNDPFVHQDYSYLLSINGRHDESLRELRASKLLDPLSTLVGNFEGWALYLGRRFAEAETCYRAVERVDTASAVPHYSLGQIYEAQGRMKEAIVEYRQGARLADDGVGPGYLGHALAVAGQTAEARTLLRSLEHPSAGFYVGPVSLALIHLGLGDRDGFYSIAEQAVAKRDEDVVWLWVNPLVDSLRSDPRFRDLAKRMNLPS